MFFNKNSLFFVATILYTLNLFFITASVSPCLFLYSIYYTFCLIVITCPKIAKKNNPNNVGLFLGLSGFFLS